MAKLTNHAPFLLMRPNKLSLAWKAGAQKVRLFKKSATYGH
jgi:hypothetical protein